VSTTGGSAWNEIKLNVPLYGQMVPGSILISGRNYDAPNTMAVFKTTDQGLSWQTSLLTTEGMGCAYAMAVHPGDKNILFAGGGEVVSGGETFALFKSTDGGSGWVRTGLTGSGSIRSIVFDSKNARRMYLGTSLGVYVSTDGGENWQKPASSFYIYCLLPDPDTGLKLWAGTGSGVSVTTDGGLTWSALGSELANIIVQCLAYDAADRCLFAGTIGGGVFRLSGASGVAEEHRAGQPGTSVLHQNYPNPFNGTTEIRYAVLRAGKVRLDVLDVQGQMIRRLSDMIESEGEKRVVWNGIDEAGRTVPSGVYLIVLTARGGVMSIRKTVCIK
jgi:photosystem II stability/assembly factor-like uncharacterized protein